MHIKDIGPLPLPDVQRMPGWARSRLLFDGASYWIPVASLGVIGCSFLSEEGDGVYSCIVHESKPTMCAEWPNWSKATKSERAVILKVCPGMKSDAGHTKSKHGPDSSRDPGVQGTR